MLRNFAVNTENNHSKIYVIDLHQFKVEYKNTKKAFYVKNLYDLKSENQKELERKIGNKIERPMGQVVKKFLANQKLVELTRKELDTIRKYFLLQIYRTPRNKVSYTHPSAGVPTFSRFNICDYETNEDFWKREMLEIVESRWELLLTTDMVGVKSHALEINSMFLMFVNTMDEFWINDLGYATERISVTIPDSKKQSILRWLKK